MRPRDLLQYHRTSMTKPVGISSESLMHETVYQHAPKARAVVHAHPPHAVALSVAFPEMTEIPKSYMSEVVLAVGEIPIVDFALPGTLDMGTNLVPHLNKKFSSDTVGCRVMVLRKHGALCWGETLQEAWLGMERLEHVSLTIYLAFTLEDSRKFEPISESVLRDFKLKFAARGGKTL